MIFTCYIRNGNFGYSKFTQQDNHNRLVKQATRKFHKLPWLAGGRCKLVRQSVKMTLHPPENFPGDGPDWSNMCAIG
jgi:hypothetical protein